MRSGEGRREGPGGAGDGVCWARGGAGSGTVRWGERRWWGPCWPALEGALGFSRRPSERPRGLGFHSTAHDCRPALSQRWRTACGRGPAPARPSRRRRRSGGGGAWRAGSASSCAGTRGGWDPTPQAARRVVCRSQARLPRGARLVVPPGVCRGHCHAQPGPPFHPQLHRLASGCAVGHVQQARASGNRALHGAVWRRLRRHHPYLPHQGARRGQTGAGTACGTWAWGVFLVLKIWAFRQPSNLRWEGGADGNCQARMHRGVDCTVVSPLRRPLCDTPVPAFSLRPRSPWTT